MTQRGRDAKGRVYLVGAGPGDPGLLTCRGLEVLQKAEVLVYDGLAPIELLAHTSADCEHIYAGKKRSPHGTPFSQEDINALLVARAAAGQIVVRLKGGDPFVFGRGAEECLALAEEGLPFEVVPGVSAATAVAAYAGIPLTARGIAASAVLVTGHEAADKSTGGVDWKSVAGHQSIVLFMAWKQIGDCVEKLVEAGKSPDTLAAAIRWGTRAGQLTVKTTLAGLPAVMSRPEMRPPILVVIGDVVGVSDKLAWFEQRPLFGKRVLLTREPERAQAVSSELRDLGADVLIAPTTRIVFPSDDELASLGNALVAREWDWLLLSSANSVRACQRALHLAKGDARSLAGGRIAAVGRATHAALLEVGLVADLVPEKGTGSGLAQTLLQELGGKAARVLYPRAESGRPEAIAQLTAAGCQVTVRSAYASAVRANSEPALVDALAKLRAKSLHCIAFFAPSQLAALCEMGDDVEALLAKVPVLAAIGPTTEAALQARGLKATAVAAAPTSEHIAKAIADAFFASAAA